MTDDVPVDPIKDPNVEPVVDPPKEDPLLELLVGMKDDNQKIIVDTINMLQGKITKLEKEAGETKTEHDNDKKMAIIKMLKDADYDVKGFETKSLESLQDIAELLSQNNDKIVIKTKKDDDFNNPDYDTKVWDPSINDFRSFFKGVESK